jgi:uncharacterized protein YaiI (UPF0178 family)
VTIWADGDSLQAELRRLICRRANREAELSAAAGRPARFRAVFVAARLPPLDLGPGVEAIDVSKFSEGVSLRARDDLITSEGERTRDRPREGAADDYIVASALPGDLAVTRDLPLVERLAEKGLRVLNDRGEVFTAGDARERRSLRDAAAELRALGLAPESPRRSGWGERELKAFADALDRELSRRT